MLEVCDQPAYKVAKFWTQAEESKEGYTHSLRTLAGSSAGHLGALRDRLLFSSKRCRKAELCR